MTPQALALSVHDALPYQVHDVRPAQVDCTGNLMAGLLSYFVVTVCYPRSEVEQLETGKCVVHRWILAWPIPIL